MATLDGRRHRHAVKFSTAALFTLLFADCARERAHVDGPPECEPDQPRFNIDGRTRCVHREVP